MSIPADQPARPRVLLVEDYAPNVLVATTYFEIFGFDFAVAENGHEAVRLAKEGGFTVVMMDVQMAGLDGLSATREIRAHEAATGAARVPIIGVTAHALTGDRERCLAAGMDEYMSKPYNADVLRETILRLNRG